MKGSYLNNNQLFKEWLGYTWDRVRARLLHDGVQLGHGWIP